MTLVARFLIFGVVPTMTGLAGWGISHLQRYQSKLYQEEGGELHEVDFDRDFVTPFLLAMALVVVLGFQTNGFAMGAGDPRRKGAIVWPKARTVQRVRHQRVVVDDDADKKEQ